MKYKMIGLILALTVVTWSQTATPNAPATTPQSTAPADKAKPACCDKMSATDAKDEHPSCMHHDMSSAHHDMSKMSSAEDKGMDSCCAGKEASSSCCSGKEAMSCKSDKDTAAASCSGDKCGKDMTAGACCGSSCEKDAEKGCCSKKAEVD